MERIEGMDRAFAGEAPEQRLRRLLVHGLDGDAKAYHLFLKDLSAHLRAFFRKRLVQLPDDVEDLVQETLLAVHNQRHTYRRDQPLTAWVHAIARYKLVDLLRARSCREALNDPLDEEHELFAANDHEAAAARRDLAKLLDELPDRQRLPIVHVKLEGLSVVEAAQLTGMSVAAVKIGVHRGLKVIAARIRSALLKTDELVSMLAEGVAPVDAHAVARRFALALAWGVPAAFAVMAIMLGLRPDLAAATRLPMFWVKLVVPAAVGLAALVAAQRLGRPGMRLGGVLLAIVAPVAALWLMAGGMLAGAEPGERPGLVLGSTWRTCPFNIAMISLPLFVAAFWAMKGLAPTRLALAGAGAGLLAGAVAAVVYTFHCPEMKAPFLAVWYVLGMVIPAVVGAALGPRLLRW